MDIKIRKAGPIEAAELTAIAFAGRAGDDPRAEDFSLHVEPFAGPKITWPIYVLSSYLPVA